MGAFDRPSGPADEPAQPDRPPRGPEPKVGDTYPTRPFTRGPDSGRGPEPRIDGPRVLPNGSWEWEEKDLRLSPEDSRIADRSLAACLRAEGRDDEGNYTDRGLTPAMHRTEAAIPDAQLLGCPDFSLKSADRFKEKLARRIIDEPDVPTEQLADEIADGVRYTFAFETNRYTEGTRATIERLQGEGYELTNLRNFWGGTEYKGINSQWRDPDSGRAFEIHFHTPESWDATQVTHDAFEYRKDHR